MLTRLFNVSSFSLTASPNSIRDREGRSELTIQLMTDFEKTFPPESFNDLETNSQWCYKKKK